MAYVVLDENGKPVVAVDPNDPDLQRLLARIQNAVPYLGPKSAAPTFATSAPAQSPGRAQRKVVAHAAPKELKADAWYQVRHVPTGRMLPKTLNPEKVGPPGIYNDLRSVRLAVARAVNQGFGAKAEFEIIEVPKQT